MSWRACVMACLALSVALLAPAESSAQLPTFQIAFQSDRDGNTSDLWLVDSNGANERPLTRTPEPEAAPSWSPDGRSIVYSCAPEDNWDVCTIDIATLEVTRVTETSRAEFDPRYTSDGTQIVLESYSSNLNADIAIVPASGGIPALLTSTPGVDDQDPAPDPVGSRIAFASDGKIAVLDSPATRNITLLAGGTGSDTDPAFSSGDEIAFGGRLGGVAVAGPPAADGTRRTRQLTRRAKRRCTSNGRPVSCRTRKPIARAQLRSAAAAGAQADIEPAWTAAATDLLFARMRTTDRGFRIYLMDAAGQNLRAVTKGGAYSDTEPAAGPAGSSSLLTRMLRFDVRAASAGCGKINGTAGNNTLKGTASRDCMWGRGGSDVLSGGRGDDKLAGDAGRDQLNGEDGKDIFYATDGEKDYISGGKGADQTYGDTGLDVETSAVDH